MEEDDFNWYEEVLEADIEEFEPADKGKSTTSKLFDILIKVFRYVFLITLVVLFYRYLFKYETATFFGVDLDIFLFGITVYCGSLIIIAGLSRGAVYLIKQMSSEQLEKKALSIYKWAALGIWFILNLYLLKYFKKGLGDYYKLIRSFLLSGTLTCISFTGVAIAMQYFYEYFLQKSLYLKMNEVDSKERIIAAMKSFRYELSESSLSVTEECKCQDIFCCNNSDIENTDENASHIELKMEEDNKVGDMYLKGPEIQTLYDAKTLARDVFRKGSQDGVVFTFEDFSKMFPNTQIALQAFSYFDSNDDREVSKKEFRDTIVGFYMDRVNLEKNFGIAKGFVDIVADVFYIIVSAFLCLAYLIIFGIPLKDLLALALSSALMLNFLVSGMAVDLYFNFMVLLSHPFDIGDDVIVDGVDYKVYKIGLSSTSLLGANGGKVKFLNSKLWQKNLINMTRAPEKIILFEFELDPALDVEKLKELKMRIFLFVKQRSYDFYESFSLEAKSESDTNLKSLNCCLILRCKSYKSKAKKFQLRVEISKFLKDTMDELGIIAL
ncbi:Mechanosensitive ion channel protein 8 [Astathelohania contejeani]|uniref:Mechanosensitive ion channel protein 8 n=1 Tax=Astathelohania contejeani TaxID=164912 RepID=A0ABQ7I0Z8_9MICR|nr:Mechanosensitive ion channel protein 8 [Thelohania contejeani]